MDPSSYANVTFVVVLSMYINLEADFAKKVLHGFVALTMQAIADNCTEVVLDTKKLQISSVTDDSGKALEVRIKVHNVRLIKSVVFPWQRAFRQGTWRSPPHQTCSSSKRGNYFFAIYCIFYQLREQWHTVAASKVSILNFYIS